MSDIFDGEPPPAALSHLLTNAQVDRVTGGCSGDRVFRIDAADRDMLYLKHAGADRADRLQAEQERLGWLQTQGIAAARCRDFYRGPDGAWLVMSAVPGLPAADCDATEGLVAAIAVAYRALHAIELSSCPFDSRLAFRLAHAADAVAGGNVDEDDFEPEHYGWTAADLLERLQHNAPGDEDSVVTHGDATLENMLVKNGRVTGFIDCGKLGRADRYQDLALITRSIADDFDADYISVFFDAYGIDRIDPDKLYYYRLLDEFF